jgi:DNA invertase Pin-like site-specific DNA recombinase
MSIPTKTQLLKLQKRYKTDGAIGDLYGISRQAVHQWRTKYGIRSLRELTEARNYDIRKAYKNGSPVTKIANKFGLSYSQVYRILR